MRPCRLCSESFADGEYNPRTIGARDGSVICPACLKKRQAGYDAKRDHAALLATKYRWVANNPESRRVARRKWLFGVDAAKFQAMLDAQGGCCALCKMDLEGRETFIDHDHACCPGKGRRTCGKCVRAVLCRRCNQGLGMFDDNPDLLIAASMYVMKLDNALAQISEAPSQV